MPHDHDENFSSGLKLPKSSAALEKFIINETEKIVAEVEKTIFESLTSDDKEASFMKSASAQSDGNGGEIERPDNTEVEMLISNIGVLMDWPAAYTWNSGPMDAFVLVQLKDDRTRTSLDHASRDPSPPYPFSISAPSRKTSTSPTA